jgi:hypothetical protein
MIMTYAFDSPQVALHLHHPKHKCQAVAGREVGKQWKVRGGGARAAAVLYVECLFSGVHPCDGSHQRLLNKRNTTYMDETIPVHP